VQGISNEAEQNLLAYSWSGDMRELKDVMERAMILDVDKEVLPEHLAQEILVTRLESTE
jgi:transcriptional regulator with PAS, ATPase and Fis domain